MTTIKEQKVLFAGCETEGKKIRTSEWGSLDRKRFNVIFGGRTFQLNSEGTKITLSAWLAFHHGEWREK